MPTPAVVRPALNARWFKIVVFGLHVIFVAVLISLFLIHDVSYQMPIFAQIAPVAALYENYAIGWLAHTRELAHLILTIFDGLGGLLLVTYGLKRRHIVPKFFAVAVGSQLLFSAALSASLLGLVLWGGVWHFMSTIIAIAMAGSAAITFAALALFWKDLVQIGQKQDELIKMRFDQKTPPVDQ